MEKLTANISGKARRAKFFGRDYLVAPLSMLVPGVLNGSAGALYYPPEEVAASADAWNGTPITLNHPTVNGAPASARDPRVLDEVGLGFVFGSVFNSKLSAEGWFDVEQTRRVEPRVLAALEANRPIELSTGLFTTNEEAPAGSAHNGAAYTHVARHYRADHLAVLPDAVGACSLKDGCGVNNAAASPYGYCPRCGAPGTDRERRPGGNDTCGNGHTYPSRDALREPPTANVRPNEPSHDELRRRLGALLDQRFGAGGMDVMPPTYILDVFDKEVIFARDGKAWSLGYATDLRTGAVALADEAPAEVRQVTTYKPATNQQTPPGDTAVNKDQLIQYLTANCSCWKGSTAAAALAKLDEAELQELKANAEQSAALVANLKAEAAAATAAKSAPRLTAEEQETLNWAGAERQRQKALLVERLLVNVSDPAARQAKGAKLMTKSQAELQDLVELLPAATQATTQNQAWDFTKPIPLYYGAPGVPATNAQDDDPDDVLPLPTTEYHDPRTRRQA